MNQAIEPGGTITSVDHEVTTKGEATTSVNMPEKTPDLTIMSFLDSSARAVIMKLPQGTKGGN